MRGGKSECCGLPPNGLLPYELPRLEDTDEQELDIEGDIGAAKGPTKAADGGSVELSEAVEEVLASEMAAPAQPLKRFRRGSCEDASALSDMAARGDVMLSGAVLATGVTSGLALGHGLKGTGDEERDREGWSSFATETGGQVSSSEVPVDPIGTSEWPSVGDA